MEKWRVARVKDVGKEEDSRREIKVCPEGPQRLERERENPTLASLTLSQPHLSFPSFFAARGIITFVLRA